MENIISLVESASVIVLAVLFLTLLAGRIDRYPLSGSALIGVVFGIVGVMSMISPVEFVSGFRTDARNIVVALAAITGGPIGAALSAIIVSSTRAYFGGAGAVGGIVSIWAVAIVTSLFTLYRRHRGNRHVGFLDILGGAVIAAGVPLTIIHFTAAGSDPALAFRILLFVVPANFIGTLLLGTLIVRDRQRRWALTAHHEGQAQLHAIANNAPGVLFQFVRDENGRSRLQDVSGGALRFLGISAERLIQDPTAFEQALSPEALAEIEKNLGESAESRHAWMLETEFKRPDGEILWMRLAAEPRIDAKGELVWDGSLFDITEQKRSERLKSEFISVVSHELRTPLTSIRGSLGLIAGTMANDLPEKTNRLIEIAHKNSERLIHLINDILDIDKLTSGQMAFEIGPENLCRLVEQSMKANRAYADRFNVRFELKAGDPDLCVVVDPDRLTQVLANLLSNAAKFSEDGGVVEVRIDCVEGQARVLVRDFGPGVPEEFREHVFERFAQADSSSTRKKGGTGLGLHISKQIMERMQGDIGFESGEGEGAVFWITMPAIDAASVPAPVIWSAAPQRVLVCHDVGSDGSGVAQALVKEGFQVEQAVGAAGVRRKMGESVFDAVVLDHSGAGGRLLGYFTKLHSAAAGSSMVVVAGNAARGDLGWFDQPPTVAAQFVGPLDADRLVAAVRKAAAHSPRAMPRILHVEDDSDLSRMLASALYEKAEIVGATTLAEARRLLAETTFQLVLLDASLPDGNGLTLLEEIGAGSPGAPPVMVLSANEMSRSVRRRVAAAMVKSRVSETAIVETIINLVGAPSVQGSERIAS